MAKWTFKSRDFYALLEKQQRKCPVTARELTPETTVASHIVPLRKGGKHEVENIYLVNSDLLDIKKNLTDEELASLCYDVLKTIGGKYGYSVSRVSKNIRP